MLIPPDDPAPVFPGDHGDITIGQVDRFSRLPELVKQFPRLEPGAVAVIGNLKVSVMSLMAAISRSDRAPWTSSARTTPGT